MYEFEEWKPIEGYEGRYEVSNYGRVKSLNFNKTGKPKILKAQKHGKYLFINSLHEYLHVLVAKTFIPNFYKLPCVNHRDQNPKNCCVWNLEWCSYAYNNSYSDRVERISISRQKPILQYTKSMELVAEYKSGIEAEKATGINRKNISNCCRCKYGFKTAGGYIWKFKEVA